MTERPALRIEGLGFAYRSSAKQTREVLRDVELEVARGEFVSIVGASGIGKSTLLHLLAGLISPAQGSICLDQGPCAMVFQRSRLLAWQTVLDNALFGVECAQGLLPGAEERARELLSRMGLGAHLHDYPHQLSEGMKQRVNLARALLLQPKLLLMDEPFSALDPSTRRRLQDELVELWQEQEMSILFVSHSLDEVVYLSDRVLFLSNKPGKIVGESAIELPRPRGTSPEAKLELFQLSESLNRRFLALS